MKPNKKLRDVLLPAFNPCQYIDVCDASCREAKWSPLDGHVPRGFLGATARMIDVEVVMVMAEPGHPYSGQSFVPDASPGTMLEAACLDTYRIRQAASGQFHRNMRWFLDELYPGMTFDEQLRYVWMTEGRLCSIENEIGNLVDHTCAQNYLGTQLALLSHATVVAFGGKAKRYLRKLKVDFVGAYALAPPGANHKPAKPTWRNAIDAIKAKRVARE
ncbi:hypothetical protein [Sphingopyxis sp.]|uniref:hypothetical protein n=1 Tax=Sphingopyxis sp. TaxID=1908224 RepID=UPI0035AD9A13